jgi:radical SAM superfamily enzyme YgiQ (UPF0313 family)
MNKPHQRIDDMFEAARKCRQAGIRTTFNLIFGYPGETDEDRGETFRVMSAIAREFDNVTFSPNIFTPYPGLPIWDELRRHGLEEPDRLEAWSRFALGSSELPWLRGGVLERIQRSISFFLLNNQIAKAARRARPRGLQRAALRALARPLHWRLERQRFGWPMELWLMRAKRRLVLRRSLVTGRSLPEVC